MAGTKKYRKTTLADQLAESLQAQIESGVLKDGSALPSRRKLAEEWNISTYTVKTAVELLARRGLVKDYPRSRTVVLGPESLSKVCRASPTVTLVAGHIGTGKSRYGRALANESGWALLGGSLLTTRLGSEILQLSGVSPFDLESDVYQEIVRPLEIATLVDLAVENIRCGNSTIVVAPLLEEVTSDKWLSEFRLTVEDLGGLVEVAWVHSSERAMYQRIRNRGAASDVVKINDWDRHLASIDLGQRPAGDYTSVDGLATDRELRDQAQEILQGLLHGSWSVKLDRDRLTRQG